MFPSLKITLQQETMASLQIQLDKAAAKEKRYLQTTVSKEVYEEVCRKSASCQDDLTQALEKVGYTLSSPGLFNIQVIPAACKVKESISCMAGCHQGHLQTLASAGMSVQRRPASP